MPDVSFVAATTHMMFGNPPYPVVPAGTTTGDLILVFFTISTSSAGWSAPGGWSTVIDAHPNRVLTMFSKVYNSAVDPAPGNSWSGFSVTDPNGYYGKGGVVAYRNTNGGIYSATWSSTTSGSVVTAPSLTSPIRRSMFICIACSGHNTGGAFGGQTFRASMDGGSVNGAWQLSDELAAAGTTGTRTVETTYSGNDHIGASVMLQGYNTAPSTPTVMIPNGGEVWNASHNITWGAATDSDNDPITYRVELTINNGASWDYVLTASTSSTSLSYSFSSIPGSSQCKIRVRASDGMTTGGWDESNAVFSIIHQTHQMVI